MATKSAKSRRGQLGKGTTAGATGSRQGSGEVQASEECIAFTTQLGAMSLAWRGNLVTRISIGNASEAAALAALSADDSRPTASPPPFIQQLVERLQRYAAGDRSVVFEDISLDLSHLSPFQKKVVDRCRRICAGRTRTYGELAALAGYPGAARAVGSVMSRNRYPIVVPCHRVVGSAGSLGGFSAPQGICLKERMLMLEGVLQDSSHKIPPRTKRKPK